MVYISRQGEDKDFGSNLGSPLTGSYHLEHDTLPETLLYNRNEKNKTYFTCCFEDYVLLV